VGEEEKEIKVVLDTNVLISILVFRGRLSMIRTAWREARIVPVLSRETFQEFVDALGYPKFALSREEIAFLIEDEILPYFEVVNASENVTGACRDPNDDKFLSCAVSAAAGHLVSGDKDLLELGEFKGVKIVSPADFGKFL
jgi:putative PIN family toxin of toxin-antitoxin system